MNSARGKTPHPRPLDILVVGGGNFGTAIATVLARLNRRLKIWVRREEQAREINEQHTNSRYFKDLHLPENLEATTDLAHAVTAAKVVLMSVPSSSFREVSRRVGDHLKGDQILIHATKGIERGTFRRMSEILKEETCALKIGVLSGPNLAKEIMRGDPAGALIASSFDEVVDTVQLLFAGGRFRVYGGHDVIGTEIGGAFKNIIALAAGVVDGMSLGTNTKALLITRGLSEMARFGVALGGDVFTFGGLAGIGDLMATCASPLSRNHQVGQRLAQGETLEEILQSMVEVAEGLPTTLAVRDQARGLRLDLPIVQAVHAMLYEGQTPLDAISHLTRLPVGRELAALRYK